MVIFNSCVKLPHCNCPTACLLVKRDFFNTKPKVIKKMEESTKHGNLTQRWIWCDQPTDIHYLSKEQQGVSKTVNGFMAKPGPKNHLLGATHQRSLVCVFFTAEGICAVSCLISQLAFPAPVLPVLPRIGWMEIFDGWNPWIWWQNQMRFQCWWQPLNLSIEFLIFRVSIWTWLKGPIIYIYTYGNSFRVY